MGGGTKKLVTDTVTVLGYEEHKYVFLIICKHPIDLEIKLSYKTEYTFVEML